MSAFHPLGTFSSASLPSAPKFREGANRPNERRLSALLRPTRRHPVRFNGTGLLTTLGALGELGPSCFGSAATIPHVGQGGVVAVFALLLGASEEESQRVRAFHLPGLPCIAGRLLRSFSRLQVGRPHLSPVVLLDVVGHALVFL